MSAYDEEDSPSMDDALERARARGGKDTFNVLGDEKKPPDTSHIADAVASLTPPEEKASPAPEAPKAPELGPVNGPVEPPPPTPPDVAPPPEGTPGAVQAERLPQAAGARGA